MRKVMCLAVVAMMATLVSADSQIFKTALRITVIDDLGNFQEGATVRLFETEEEYFMQSYFKKVCTPLHNFVIVTMLF